MAIKEGIACPTCGCRDVYQVAGEPTIKNKGSELDSAIHRCNYCRSSFFAPIKVDEQDSKTLPVSIFLRTPCPVCHSTNTTQKKTGRMVRGKLIRYHKCHNPKCGAKFKSKE